MINSYRLLTFWLMLNVLTSVGISIGEQALVNNQADTTGSIYTEAREYSSLAPQPTDIQQSFDSTAYQQAENNYEKSPGSNFMMGMNIMKLFVVGLVPFVHLTMAHDQLELMVLLMLDMINTFIVVYLLIKAWAFFKNKGGE